MPSLSYNLVSVSKAAERGKDAKFDQDGCKIVSKSGRIVARAHRRGSLYYLDCRAAERVTITQQSPNQTTLWHRRFGHLSGQALHKLSRDKLVHGLDCTLSDQVDFCEACVNGKHKRAPFKSRSSKSTKPLELVHSDVCGKMNTPSLGGGEYFLTFIDDYTHYTWVYVLKRKSEVFDKFQKWKALVENESGHNLKVLRTDRGGEYTSAEFEKFLQSAGVRHELTVPKTPEQNGVAERMNRTLVESVRSMLSDANLPQKFWAEAVSTAVYLRNRSPTKAVDDMTPFEAWMKKRPSVSHLRVFGCKAYVHVPKDERGKLDNKAKKCILVGYGEETKGYRLYDPDKKRICFSRDVSFNESECGIELDVTPSGGDLYVELELQDESSVSPDQPVVAELAPVHQPPEQPSTRRSGRERRFPDYYGDRVYLSLIEPTSVDEILSTPEKDCWLEAMEKEMTSLQDNDVWELVEPPQNRKPVGSKWVFKAKTDADGHVERYKARLVAQGFSQKFGTDYDETFSPVARLESVRALIALSVQQGLKLHQVDVTTAFLNGELEEEVYMKQPEGFVVPGKEHLVCKLKKSIYGLKQSPRCWNTALHNQLKKMGFVQTATDPCVYTYSGGEVVYLGVYVDDIIVAAQSDKKLAEVKKELASRFDIKDLGKLHHFLGMKIVQDEATGSVWIGQPAYTESILKKFGMENAKISPTPVDPSNKLVKATEADEPFDQHIYQSAIGSLLYLSVATRPDISYAVSNVAKFSANPTTRHWNAVKRIMRYLKGTSDLGLVFKPQKNCDCVGYSDADWGGDLDDRKSTSGYVFQIGGGAVSWRSKKQTSVALSTAEAEYVALAFTAQEALWLRHFLTDMIAEPPGPMVIYEDNQSAIAMTKSPQFHGRSKHISIKYHFIRDLLMDGMVEVKYCPSQEMIADMLTKGLSKNVLVKLRAMIGLVKCSGSE